MAPRGLGRVPHFDPRNLDFLISDYVEPLPDAKKLALLGARASTEFSDAAANVASLTTLPAERSAIYWNDTAWWGDQGDTPHCTAFAAMHFVADGPVTHPHEKPFVEPHAFFEEIRRIDVSEGRDYGGDGATSLAMCKALKNRGLIGSYLWGYSLDDLLNALRVGPVVLGLDWYEGMDYPEKKTAIIRATGRIRGGHEIECNGVNFEKGLLRLKQSWTRALYGKNGHAELPFEDAEKLIVSGGDVGMMRELKVDKVV